MHELIAHHIGTFAGYAHVWGFLLIFAFMAIESSIIPLPSEVVMIPAGFMAWRGELTTGNFALDAALAILAGTVGSLAGAYVNYYVALKLGRTVLHRYGKYFLLSEKALDRGEALFREYGEVLTFVSRLLPVLRHLISIPAGLAEMNLRRFIVFTLAGAAVWVTILTAIGAWLGRLAGDMSYIQMVDRGSRMISEHTGVLVVFSVMAVAAYYFIHRKIMHGARLDCRK